MRKSAGTAPDPHSSFKASRNSSIGIAAMDTVSRVPRDPNDTMILTTVSLSGASRMFMKSYFPRRAYC